MVVRAPLPPFPFVDESDLDLLRPREEISLLDWTERHVLVTEGPLVPGGAEPIPWNSDLFPLQRTIVEAIDDKRWARVYLMTAPQAFGKTQCAALPTLLYALRYREVSVLYCAANLNLAVTQWRRKIEPAMRAEPTLAALIHENPDKGGRTTRRDFTNETSLHCAGADSVGALSGFTVPVVICDDLQAYPASLPGFGSPADMAFDRSGAYPSEQVTHIGIGTAGAVDDYLWRSMAASALFCPFVPCLTCGTYQLLEFNRLQFDQENVEAARADTWLACAEPDCSHHITFDELPEMLGEHLWVSCPSDADWITKPTEGGVLLADVRAASVYPDTRRNTSHAGFWCNALYWSLGMTWGERAVEWLGCKGDPTAEQDHQQNVRVVPWQEPEIDEEKLTEEEVLSHIAPGYPAGTVPVDADCVTCTNDVHAGYVWYIIRAWQKSTGTSWLVDMGTEGRPIRNVQDEADRRARRAATIPAALDAVDAKCRVGWERIKPDGEIVGRIGLTLGLIDRGFEPDIIGGWWLRHHGGVWHLIRGLEAGKEGSLWPRKPQRDPRGRPYRKVAVNAAKHAVRRCMRVPVGEPGHWHMPASGLHANTQRAYARHMASERFDKTRPTPAWVKITPGVANHAWDDEAYQICAAVACGVKLPGAEQLITKAEPRTDYFKKQVGRRSSRGRR
jgi:hypothetical protein